MNLNLYIQTELILNKKIKHISSYFNIDSHQVELIYKLISPVLIVCMLKKIDTLQSADDLFAAISSSMVDSNIDINILSTLHNSYTFKNFIALGDSQLYFLMGKSFKSKSLVEIIAKESTITFNIVYSLICINVAIMFGLIKQHVKLHPSPQHALILLLRDQILYLEISIDEKIWRSLDFGDIKLFFVEIKNSLNIITQNDSPRQNIQTLDISISQFNKQSLSVDSYWLWVVILIFVSAFLMLWAFTL